MQRCRSAKGRRLYDTVRRLQRSRFSRHAYPAVACGVCRGGMFCDKPFVPAEIAVYSAGITLYGMRGSDVLLFGGRHSDSRFR